MKCSERILGIVILCGIILLVNSLPTFAADPVITEKKAAEVNGATITMMSLNNEYRQVLKQQGISEDNLPAEKVLEVKKEVLDALINQELLFQESKKSNISVDEKSVAEDFAKVKGAFESEDDYKAALKDANLQESDILTRIRRKIAIDELVDQQISRNIVVTDEEAKNYYDTHPDAFVKKEKVRASHILIKVDPDASEAKKAAAKKKIQEIQRRIKAGEDFAQLAKENSEGPTGPNGGDLGYFERGKMVKEFEDAAFALAPGQVSDIVQTKFGYHLIKVTDRIEGGTIAYETVKSDLEDYLKRKKISEGVSSYIETLRKSAKIETYL